MRAGLFHLVIMIFVSALFAENLRDQDGAVLRGTAMVIGKPYRPDGPEPVMAKALLNPQRWDSLKTLGFNTIRIVWIDPYVSTDTNWNFPGTWWSVDEMLPSLDSAVAIGTKKNMNMIINYHHVGEWVKFKNFGMNAEFWSKVASRYKNNPRIYYELNNEQAWSKNDYLLPNFMDTMKTIYEQVRKDAPDRRIIMFSFPTLALPMKSISDAYKWVDWNSTSVGFHMYGTVGVSTTKEQSNLEELLANYNVVCTEWFYPGHGNFIKEYYGYHLNAQALESKSISWMDWRDWNDESLDFVLDSLLPDSKAKGYFWNTSSTNIHNGNKFKNYSNVYKSRVSIFDLLGRHIPE